MRNIFKVLIVLLLSIYIKTFNVYGLENENINSEQIIKNIYNLKIEQKNIAEKILDIDKTIESKRVEQNENNEVEVVQVNFIDEKDNLKDFKEIINRSIENEIKQLEESKIHLKYKLEKLEEDEINFKNNISGKINYGDWPLPGYNRISSPYGYRIHPITKNKKFHKGIDIPADYGTNVLATDYGIVTFSGVQNGYGNIVAIKHFDGKTSIYGHNSKNIVNEGDLVYKGQAIAKVGSTGRSTGNHVHFEVTINGELKNPLEVTNK